MLLLGAAIIPWVIREPEIKTDYKKYERAIDSLKSLNNSLTLKYYKKELEAIKWQMKADSVKEKIVYLKDKRDDKIRSIDGLNNDELYKFFANYPKGTY